MHEVVVKYKNQKTLKALMALGEYLGFTVTEPSSPKKDSVYEINGVPVESGDPSIDIHELNAIFTGKDIDAVSLRKSAWQRKR